MFKCINCGEVSKKGDTPFTRTKYFYELDELGNSVRRNIIREIRNNCSKCYKKLGAEIK